MVTPVAENRRSELARSFESIFRTGNPYKQPFRPEIVGRLLLFPIFACALEEEQFEAVSRAAAGLGERQGFVMDVEEWDERDTNDHKMWELDLDDYASYIEYGSR